MLKRYQKMAIWLDGDSVKDSYTCLSALLIFFKSEENMKTGVGTT